MKSEFTLQAKTVEEAITTASMELGVASTDLEYEVIEKGIIVEDKLTINDGVRIDVIHCTSPHTDGSLILTVNNEYTLIADLYFTRPPFDKEKAMKMIDSLRSIDTKYFVISHQEDQKVIPKETLIQELTEYLRSIPSVMYIHYSTYKKTALVFMK